MGKLGFISSLARKAQLYSQEISWALLRGSVIQANGRLAFEDGLRSGGPLHCVSHCTSVRTNLADIMDTLKKFKVAMLSEEVGC